MRRRHSVAVVLVFSLLVSIGVSPGSAQDTFSDAVIFATNSVHLKNDTIVASGDVVVNEASAGPTLAAGVELGIDRNAALAGDVAADSIARSTGVVIAGDVSCNDGSGVTCSGLSLPVFAPQEIPPFHEAALRDDAPDVEVGDGASGFLVASDYADVTVGRGGTLVFGGGVYNIGSILAGAYSRLEFSAPTELRILGRFDLGQLGYLGPVPGSAVAASNIILYIGGTNGSAGAPSSQPAAASIGKQSVVRVNLYVPDGTFELMRGATATGAVLARDVLIDQGSVLHLASFFNPPPTADTQDAFTSGTSPLLVTLTGSDPAGELLVFTIVAGPSNGTLSSLTQGPPASATVTYAASQTGNLADSFTFRVTDPNGGFADAVVLINPSDDPEGPGEPSNTVIGRDDAFEVLADTASELFLLGITDVEDPSQVGDLTFGIVSGPSHGSLDPSPPTPSGPVPVRSATTTYTPAPSYEGPDGFVFEVCGDLSIPADGDTLDPGECDTASVTIEVRAFVPPEPPVPPAVVDQSVSTPIDIPVEIELALENSGGSRLLSEHSLLALDAGGGGKIVVEAAATSVMKAAATFGDEATFLAELSSSSTYDFEQPAFPAASAIIGVVDDIDFDGRIGFAVNPPPPSGTQFMRGTGPSAPYDGPGLIDFSALEILPNAVGFFTGFGSIAAPAPLVRLRIVFADESEATYFIAHDPPAGSYFGFVDTEKAILAVELQGFEADFETEAVAKQFGIDDLTVGAGGSAEPDLVVSSLTHSPVSPIEEETIEFTAVVENTGEETAGPSTLCFEIGGESCELSPSSTLFAVPSLEPEEAFVVERTASQPAGSYQNTATADFENDVVESDEDNNTAIDTYVVTVPQEAGLFASITTLPLAGTLFSQTGLAITSTGPIFGTKVTYQPAAAAANPVFFNFTLTNSVTSLTSVEARVDILIRFLVDYCAEVGRPPGCVANQP